MLKVGDNHGHVNPVAGMGPEELAKRFARSGGWFMAVVNLLSWSLGVRVASASDFEKVYRITLDSAKRMEELGVKTAVILGPHPAELVRLYEQGVPLSRAEEMIREAYDIAARYVEEGLASGLGEAGRPHWPVPREVVEACNRVLDHVLALSRDLGAVVHLHLEPGRGAVDDVYQRVRRIGAGRVVMHHIFGSLAGYAAGLGLTPSVPAKSRELVAAFPQGPVFVVESDFLDDPRRPGAVVAPWSIAKAFRRAIAKGLVSEDDAEKILVENISRLYGVEP